MSRSHTLALWFHEKNITYSAVYVIQIDLRSRTKIFHSKSFMLIDLTCIHILLTLSSIVFALFGTYKQTICYLVKKKTDNMLQQP